MNEYFCLPFILKDMHRVVFDVYVFKVESEVSG